MSALHMTTDPREPLEYLAMFAARTPDLVGSGGGGKQAFTSADLAGAASFGFASDGGDPSRHDGPWQVALAKFARDPAARYRAGIIWYARVTSLAREHGWQVEKGVPRFRLLAHATLDHHIDGALCRGCHGARVTHQQQTCPTCDGMGTQPLPNVWWTQALDLHRNSYSAWEGRIRTCLNVLQDWEIAVDQAIRWGRRSGA